MCEAGKGSDPGTNRGGAADICSSRLPTRNTYAVRSPLRIPTLSVQYENAPKFKNWKRSLFIDVILTFAKMEFEHVGRSKASC